LEKASQQGLTLKRLTGTSDPGLPDGIFSKQKYQFGNIFERLAMEDVGIF
jgi:hypothetical protein